MLQGACITPRNRRKHTIFIDNGLIHSEQGHNIFSLSMGGGEGLAKINRETLM